MHSRNLAIIDSLMSGKTCGQVALREKLTSTRVSQIFREWVAEHKGFNLVTPTLRVVRDSRAAKNALQKLKVEAQAPHGR